MHKVALTTVACLSVMAFSAAEADTSLRKPTHIPAQKLGSALQTLAQDREFYVIFAAQDLAGLQTAGVTGELTSQEALEQLLNGTGLTFRFVDDKTVNILPIRGEARLLNAAPQLAAAPAAWLEDPAAPPPQSVGSTAVPIPGGADGELEQITVIGSRGLPRTDVERPVPVDVVSGRELLRTGQTDLGQQVQFNSPSFNSAKYGINGATNYAEPARCEAWRRIKCWCW
ncbi:MAG: hypothetical protein HC872_01105 [Gammaproteobacteria bacterium]|nr:hypothetical protein [Gammaproteobacteria bacterium]